ncbi:glycosyltransferase family 39 protein [Yinghuangia seranimata]|uniref:glycosyltransferase family 39 protein n=1 Tax=Yinghuangia seranimata TaxID=408067 RepID=UPI00248C0046|nr:glycosyltransferase family 39 protein [Yinghuangia seranimata]MDI2132710.1 glycosyltransferase family 39 protein [Yinghuangia seranimata]
MPQPSTPVVPDASAAPPAAAGAGSDVRDLAARARGAAGEAGRRFAVAVRPALPAIVGYLLARVVNLVVFGLMAFAAHKPFWKMVGSWDGLWFRDIADFGYVDRLPVSPLGKPYWVNVEFFPGYPYLMRAVSTVTGLDSLAAGMVVTFASGAVAAWGIYALGRELTGSHRVATLFALLWAVAPGSMVLTMVYSEALFVAFASWALLAIVRRRWMTAMTLTILAGFTRNTAFALVAALGVAALQVVLSRRDDGTRVGLPAPEARRPVVATVLAPLGCVGFIAWVGYIGKRWDAWFWIQDKAFNLRMDFGVSTVQWMNKYLTHLGRPIYVVCTFVIILSVALMIWSFRDRKVPLAVHVYGGLVMFLALTTSNGWFFQSKPRFMLPAFTIGLPLAALMARWPRKVAAVVLVAGAAFSGWYVGYLVYVVNTNP